MPNQVQPFTGGQSFGGFNPGFMQGTAAMMPSFGGRYGNVAPKKPTFVNVPNEIKLQQPDTSQYSPRVQQAMANAYKLQQGAADYQNQMRSKAMAENAARQQQYNQAVADYRNQQQAVQQYYRMMQMSPQQRYQYQMMMAQQQRPAMLPGQQQQQTQPTK